jgi:predicted ribosome quality control (RQC) complex YloA/Tae2 family protein
MYDLLATAAIVDELSSIVIDGRIQQIGLRDQQTLVAEIYAQRRRHYLVAAIGGREAVVYLDANPVSIDPTIVTPFTLLLRKYLRGGVVVAIDQPPLDRIIRLSIAKRMETHNRRSPEGDDLIESDSNEDADEELALGDEEVPLLYTHLSLELMGRRSNMVLVDDEGIILDSVKRVTRAMSRVRPVLPKQKFVLPPPMSRPDPRSLSTGQVELILESAPDNADAQTLLTGSVAGVSPQIARELVFRVTGEPALPAAAFGPEGAEGLAAVCRSIYATLETREWTPELYLDEAGDVAAYAALPMEHLSETYERRSVESMSEAVREAIQSAGSDLSSTRHAGRRDKLIREIEEVERRLLAKQASLERQQIAVQQASTFRRWGELIYSYLWQLEPGQPELSVEGEVIKLDPTRSPSEVAQEYFELYRKADRGAEQLPKELATVTQEGAYLRQLLTQVSQATRFDDIEALRLEWESHRSRGEAEPARGRKKVARRHSERPQTVVDPLGNTIHIGRSGPQNEHITFEVAQADDFWLHARGVPGSHVILRPPGVPDEVDETALLAAASIAAFYSAARSAGRVEVDICQRRHVRKIKGTGPGMVTYRNERTVSVEPIDEGEAMQLLNSSA